MTKPIDADIKALKAVVRGMKQIEKLPMPRRMAALGWVAARTEADRRKALEEQDTK